MTQDHWQAFPSAASSIVSPSTTIVFIESDGTEPVLGPLSGVAVGGVPPCRYVSRRIRYGHFWHSARRDSYLALTQAVGNASTLSWLVLRRRWPWHKGRFNVLYADGRTASLRKAI